MHIKIALVPFEKFSIPYLQDTVSRIFKRLGSLYHGKQSNIDNLSLLAGLKLAFKIYGSYNNFQNSSKMNFYTLLPNGFANIIRTPAQPMPQPQIINPAVQNYKSSLLPVLAQALKISIGNYAMSY